MSVFYVDTSAALKLIADESHSAAFADFYDDHADATWITSSILRIEVMRTVTRVLPDALPAARELLHAFSYLRIDDDIVDAAIAEPEPALRSLDAIHLASARALGADLDGLATYDDRLARAAAAADIAVVSPRD